MARSAKSSTPFAKQQWLPWSGDVVEETAAVSAIRSGPNGPAADETLAPPPLIDKWPIIIGQNLTLQYLSSAYRLCTQGTRYHFVDALNELLEHDPHARGVVRQRILPVAGARLEVLPAELPDTAPQGLKDKAKEIADEVRRQLNKIRKRSQAVSALAWGSIYGVSALETMWAKTDRWEVTGLQNVHSRRLNVPRPDSWDIHVWDQGSVAGGIGWESPTNGLYGLRISDYPGKFITHSPQLNGDYFTRDGEGRYIGFYLALKRTIVRATAQDFERTIRPWVVGLYNRENDGTKRTVASNADIIQLEKAVKALGLGSLNGAVLPDACRIELLREASHLDAQKFVDWLDGQVTKSLLGQTFTTSPGVHGSRSASETAREGTIDINRYDAQCLSDSFETGLVFWIVKLNFGDDAARVLLPQVRFDVDEADDPAELMRIVVDASKVDMPVDLKDIAERVGLKLVDPDDPTALRARMVSAGRDAPIEPNGSDDPNDPNYDPAAAAAAKQQASGSNQQLPAPKTRNKPKPKTGAGDKKPAAKAA